MGMVEIGGVQVSAAALISTPSLRILKSLIIVANIGSAVGHCSRNCALSQIYALAGFVRPTKAMANPNTIMCLGFIIAAFVGFRNSTRTPLIPAVFFSIA